jgi:hypothetical protein|tara:strand:+ start:121 stop:306 length:186 start_codon:yes stop_codon:yes gene_type:complete
MSGEIENCEREIELLETQLAQIRSRLLALLVGQDNLNKQTLRDMAARERQASIERARVNNK